MNVVERRREPVAPAAAAADLGGWVLAYLLTTLAKLALLAGVFRVDPLQARASDPRIYISEVATLLVMLPILTWLLHRRGGSWSDLGLRAPESWTRLGGLAVATTAAAFALNLSIRALSKLAGRGPTVSGYGDLRGHWVAILVVLVYMLFVVGFSEELIFRGFLMDRLAALFGGGRGAWSAAVATSAVVFGLLHANHGGLSILHATVIGLLFGVVYLRAGRALWVVIAAHSLFDTVQLLRAILF
jgi:membrane protease YdiL (CAAX protease family)